jgi:hypothetical protein
MQLRTKRSPSISLKTQNHLLKHEELSLEKLAPQYVSLHYNAADAQLDRETLDIIVKWLNEHDN